MKQHRNVTARQEALFERNLFAAVLTLSIPALGWFGLAALIWLVAALATRQIPRSIRLLGSRLLRAWPLLVAIAVALGVLLLVQFDALTRVVDQVNTVQASTGRLLVREPPWQVLGIWPQGDFRIPTGSVTAAWPAIILGIVAVAVAIVELPRSISRPMLS